MNYEVFRQGCFQFIHNATRGSSTEMQIGAVTQPEMPLADDSQCWQCNDHTEENLYVFGRNCYNCGGIGHMSWECPSKGKSKGGIKGKGDGKGKGKNAFSKGSFIKGSSKYNFQKKSKGISKMNYISFRSKKV